MSKTTHVAISLLLLCLLILAPTSAAGLDASSRSPLDPAAPYVHGEILVQWRDGVTAAAARTAVMAQGLTVLQDIASLRVARLKVPSGEERTHIEKLRQHPLIALAEPNYLAHAADGDSLNPNDTHWLKQWNMRRIEAPPAWTLTTGKAEVIVAVLDSGVDTGHPDLGASLLAGYDFVNNDADPDDDYGHGTHVTGILGAQLNNALGVAGVAPGVSILPLKVLDDRGAGTYANISAAIQYAAANGVAVINLSLGGDAHSDIMEQAIHNAHDAGALLVASTGNQGQSGITYPARYAEVLAVAATDHYDWWPSYSNWGPEVDLAAPGGTSVDQVWSTWPGGYGWEHGTSMAAPHVAGTAALICSVNPALTQDDIADILRQTADKVGQFDYVGERNSYLGHGRVNAHEAVRWALPPSLAVEPEQLLFLGDSYHAPTAQRVWLSNQSYQPLQWQAEELTGESWLNLVPPLSGSITYDDPDKLNVLVSTSGLSYGVYEGSLRISSSTPDAQGTPLTVPVFLSLVPELTHLYLPVVENNHTHISKHAPSCLFVRHHVMDTHASIEISSL